MNPLNPRPLFNNRCQLNCLYMTQFLLAFRWVLAERGQEKFVHAVCVTESGKIVDPTLGKMIEGYSCTFLDEPVPADYFEANEILVRLREKYEKPTTSIPSTWQKFKKRITGWRQIL